MRNIINYLVVVLFVGFLFSCNPIPNTSIFDPLPEEQWTEIAKKDTMFAEVYPQLRHTLNQANSMEIREKYKDVTYRSIMELYRYVINYRNKTSSDYKEDYKEWQSAYGKYSEKADSVINYWEKKFDENGEIEKELRYLYNYYIALDRTPDPITYKTAFKNLVGMDRNIMDYLVKKHKIYHSSQFMFVDFKAKIAESFSPIGYVSEQAYTISKLEQRVVKKYPAEYGVMNL